METLGLSKSTPKSTSRWKEFFIPDLSSAPNALSACEAAALACFIIAGVTTIVAFFTSLSGLVDAALFGLIGIGLRKASRTAALAGFLLYVAEQIYSIVALGRTSGILVILFLAILFNGVRASFTYRHIQKKLPE